MRVINLDDKENLIENLLLLNSDLKWWEGIHKEHLKELEEEMEYADREEIPYYKKQIKRTKWEIKEIQKALKFKK
jgi:hypothetical protein